MEKLGILPNFFNWYKKVIDDKVEKQENRIIGI